jgi:uncharacterized membrane protein
LIVSQDRGLTGGAYSRQLKRSTRPKRPEEPEGTILVLTAVMITIMLGMLALSIDLGYAFSARKSAPEWG